MCRLIDWCGVEHQLINVIDLAFFIVFFVIVCVDWLKRDWCADINSGFYMDKEIDICVDIDICKDT